MTRLPSNMISPNFRPGRQQKGPVSTDEAMILALGALQFLASDADKLDQLLAATGLTPENLRHGASEPGFLAGILDYLLAHEPLLLEWTQSAGLPPEVVADARRYLPGGF